MNYFITLISLLCTTLFSLHSMQEVECTKKPIIRGEIYITNEYNETTARYASQEYHNNLCRIGISSWIQCPLIKVNVLVANYKDNSITDWVIEPPALVKEYECKKINKGREMIDMKASFECFNQRKFPNFIPAFFLWKRKSGDTLLFTIHGYPTELTCANATKYNRFFEECYNSFMRSFMSNAALMCTDDSPVGGSIFDDVPFMLYAKTDIEEYQYPNQSELETQLIEHGIIEKIGRKSYRHGENGFKSIEKLLCDRIRETNRSLYFLLCMLQSPCR